MELSQEMIARVWSKSKKAYGENPNRFRKDECGAWIAGAQYGNRSSEFGWVIQRRNPNGDDSLENLCAMHWRNGVDEEGHLIFNVVAVRSHNVERGLNTVRT